MSTVFVRVFFRFRYWVKKGQNEANRNRLDADEVKKGCNSIEATKKMKLTKTRLAFILIQRLYRNASLSTSTHSPQTNTSGNCNYRWVDRSIAERVQFTFLEISFTIRLAAITHHMGNSISFVAWAIVAITGTVILSFSGLWTRYTHSKNTNFTSMVESNYVVTMITVIGARFKHVLMRKLTE